MHPYLAFATGVGKDKEGPYMALALVHEDSGSASENVDRLPEYLGGVERINDHLLWADQIDDMEIWRQGEHAAGQVSWPDICCKLVQLL